MACARESGLDHGLIITKDFEKVEMVDRIKINFMPLWKWLLKLSGYRKTVSRYKRIFFISLSK